MIALDVENIFGGRGNDAITGSAAANYLTGSTGADTIKGGGGNDKLVGACVGDTSDTVFGEAGTDIIFLGGDKVADRYNIGTGEVVNFILVTRDMKPGGGFLDVSI
jgi:Ca2+-binding RTX toxin-like protein